jgi:hypothetical protein
MESFTAKERALFKKLNTPAKVQDFLNTIPFNFESDGDSLSSPLATLRKNKAHCFEGALLGAYILSLHGFKPLVMHLQARKPDYDHVIAPFKRDGRWGALSKTNHAVLRYREPVYATIRELVMSYFHEYFLDSGIKTLQSYSDPVSLDDFEDDWVTTAQPLWGIDDELDLAKHHDIIPRSQRRRLRKADPIEREAGKVVEYKP